MSDSNTDKNGSSGQAFDAKELARLLHDVADAQIKMAKLIDGFWTDLRSLAKTCENAADEIQATARRLEETVEDAADKLRRSAAKDGAKGDQSQGGRSKDGTKGGSKDGSKGGSKNGSDERGTKTPERTWRRRTVRLQGRGGLMPDESAAAQTRVEAQATVEPAPNGDGDLELADELRYLVVEAQRLVDLLSRK